MRLGPGGIGLDHGDIAKAVDHHTGQAVSLGMDKAVEGRVEQPRAQRKRRGQAAREPVLIDLRFGIAVQHPGDDPGLRVDRDQRQRAAVGIFQHGQSTGGQALGTPVGDQLISIDPREAMADCPRFGLRLQPDGGAGPGGGRGGVV